MPALRSLRIALNATAAVTGGGMTFWLNLLPALASLGRSHEYHVLYGPTQERIRVELPPNFRFVPLSFRPPRVLRRVVWEQMGLPSWLKREKIDVLLAPADLAPLRSPCPVVLAIRNPNPHYGPPASTRRGRLRMAGLRSLTRLSAQRAAIVYFVSDDSRRRIAAGLRIPSGKTRVVYHGVGERFLDRSPSPPVPSSFGARAPYILSVSAINKHKDFATLIRAFAQFVRSDPRFADRRMVIAGRSIDPPYFESLRTLVDQLGIAKDVTFCGEVPYDNLPSLYRGAEMFVLPSQTETFGHPLVEAMACGVPVLTTDLEVSREICGEAAVYFPPADFESLASKMAELAGSASVRSARIAAGLERAARYSWKRCAAETLELMESAATR